MLLLPFKGTSSSRQRWIIQICKLFLIKCFIIFYRGHEALRVLVVRVTITIMVEVLEHDTVIIEEITGNLVLYHLVHPLKDTLLKLQALVQLLHLLLLLVVMKLKRNP